MKHNFLVDENLVIIGGDFDEQAAGIWLGIGRNSHKIGLDWQLNQKYRQKISWPSAMSRGTEVGALVARLITDILVNADKVVFVQPPGQSSLAEIVRDDDDQFLADIAAEVCNETSPSECVLITTDERTREDFNHPTMKAVGISGVSADEGLELARERCQ